MKKKLLLTIICAMTAVGVTFGQTQTLSFNPTSTIQNSNGVFNVDVSLTFSGYSSYGLSYWFEVPNALAPFISITSVTYFTFTDPQQGGTPVLFNTTTGASANYMSETRDLGATINSDLAIVPSNAIPQGTYMITTLQFTLSGAPLGSYILHSTATSPHTSEVTDTSFGDNNLPQASFTLNIVPEPSTAALIVLTLASVGVIAHRRRALRG